MKCHTEKIWFSPVHKEMYKYQEKLVSLREHTAATSTRGVQLNMLRFFSGLVTGDLSRPPSFFEQEKYFLLNFMQMSRPTLPGRILASVTSTSLSFQHHTQPIFCSKDVLLFLILSQPTQPL